MEPYTDLFVGGPRAGMMLRLPAETRKVIVRQESGAQPYYERTEKKRSGLTVWRWRR